MTSATEYLALAQQIAFSDPKRYGIDFHNGRDDTERNRLVRDVIFAQSSAAEELSEHPDEGLNLHQNIHHISRTIRDDVRERLPVELRGRWDDTVIGMLPTCLVNGCAFQRNHTLGRLDKPIIGLNSGLLLACGSLAEALTLETLPDELADFRDDGSPSFRAAVQRFLSPFPETHAATVITHDWPVEAEGKIESQTGRYVDIMLRFVALHEFGHIVNGDLDTDDLTFHALTSSIVYPEPESEARKNWPKEYAADAFAIDQLCGPTKDEAAFWANFAQAYLFLSWLEHIEATLGHPLCPRHPPPAERKLAIRRRAHAIASGNEANDHTAFIDGRIAAWSSPDP